jgi:hypothetical protein
MMLLLSGFQFVYDDQLDSNVFYAPTLAFWITVLVGHERSGFQPATESWRSGYQESRNECPVYTALLTGFQNSIRRGARPFQMTNRFIERNIDFEKP